MAIALDSANAGASFGTLGTSKTYAHTCTGDNLILFVSFVITQQNTDTLTSITYAGVEMTIVGKVQTEGVDDRWIYLYYLIGPATGANNIVLTTSGDTTGVSNAVSYTGARQSGVPDANSTAVSDGTSLTGNITTTVDNCWVTGAIRGSGGNLIAAAGSTLRGTASGFSKMIDSNGAITPAGATSLGFTCSTNPNGMVIASFAPDSFLGFSIALI